MDKIAAGRQRKADKKADKAATEQAALDADEDASWEQGGKKANKKKEADEEKKARAAARKADAADQAAEEEAELSKPKKEKKKGEGSRAPKLSRAEIAAKAMEAMKAKEKAAKQEKIDIEKSGGNEYMGVLGANDNRSDAIDASGIDDALSALELKASASGKRVNLKALYAAFEEAELVRLKADHPGLKLSQYKERCWAAWLKSAENPSNQE